MHWLIAYDISSNRRRAKVAKRLERAGLRVQKSVFVAQLTRTDLERLMDDLAGLIDVRTDTVGAWALPHAWQTEHVQAGAPGQPVFETSVVW
jgi:CRISPR-associated protein Cas2